MSEDNARPTVDEVKADFFKELMAASQKAAERLPQALGHDIEDLRLFKSLSSGNIVTMMGECVPVHEIVFHDYVRSGTRNLFLPGS